MAWFRDQTKNVSYLLGTLPFIWICIVWNLAGLVLCIVIGTPVLFFDMTGTAIASLSRGLGYGVVVALGSNLVGALFLPALPGFDPNIYMWFGFTNAVGALVWATLPRLIVHFQKGSHHDFLSTNTCAGYRTLLFQIASVGAAAGIIVGLAGLLTQNVALGCAGPDPSLCTKANPAVRTGYLISNFLHWGAFDWALPYVTLLFFGIMDKVVATASAMMVIFVFYDVPNYNEQSKKLAAYRESQRQHPKTFWIATVAYIASVSFFAIMYWHLLFETSRSINPGRLLLYFSSFIGLLIFAAHPFGVPLYNVFHRKNADADKFFHEKSLISRLSMHRDVYEDIMKTAVIAITLSGLAVDHIQHQLADKHQLVRGLAVYPNIAGGPSSPGDRFMTLAAPIVLLNLWRYFVVFLARFSGTLYPKAAPLTLSPGLSENLSRLRKLLGVALLIGLVAWAWK
jgi:hypothetical protein